MLRRLRLPGKLVVAATPLLVTVLVVSVFHTQRILAEADRIETTAHLAATWRPLTAALAAVDAEVAATVGAISGDGAAGLDPARDETDRRLDDLEAAIAAGGSSPALTRQLHVAAERITAVRAFHDESGTSAATQLVRVPEGYDAVKELLLEIGDLIPAEVPDEVFARDLAAVSALGAARKAAVAQEQAVLVRLRDNRSFGATLEIVRAARQDFQEAMASFEAAASTDWVRRYRGAEVAGAIAAAAEPLDQLVESPITVLTKPDEEWAAVFDARQRALTDLQEDLTATVIGSASERAEAGRRRAFLVVGATAGAVLLAALVTALISRSIVRRVRSLTERARHVSQEQLPALVEALRDPTDDLTLPTIPPVRDRGADEVGDLARSFAAMQSTLEHVAEQQMEVLRKGVADIFVTLARRNRSLIDRQLALIDQLESDEDDPELLADMYRLDHLATRMRRNAESLLVLAGSESPRTWRRPLEIDDVVRAAIGEVEDYRRVDVLTLEPLEVVGSAVADLSHLMSELIENATAFSPPASRVRVAGHFHEEGYLITVSDRGVGIAEPRLSELNRILHSPPVVGLALDPTLGVYVVAMLAKRHGVAVRLVAGAPGITAKVLLPPSLFHVTGATEPARPDTRAPASTSPPPPPAPGRRELAGVGMATHRVEPVERIGGPAGNGSPHAANGNGSVPASAPRPSPAPPAPPPAAPPHAAPTPGGRHATPPPHPSAPVGPPPPDPAVPLPTRVPGTSFRDEAGGEPSRPSSRPPEDLRQALGAFQGARTMGEGREELPKREPGASYRPEEADRPDSPATAGSLLGPDRIRSALSSFQTATEVARRQGGHGDGGGSDE